MKYTGIILIALLCALPYFGKAQYGESDVLDGIYTPEHTEYRRVIPYTRLREADVMWLKRVWRRIDLRQKSNHPLYYPEEPAQGRQSLFDVIKDAILKEGTLTAYDPGPLADDDMFTKPMTPDEVEGLLNKSDTSFTEDLETGELVEVIQKIEVTSREVKFYEVKEEWFFDRERSVMDVRIIGICPMKEKVSELTGEIQGVQPLFWIYYPQARFVFVKNETFNRSNDAERRTYEDIFWKRTFDSYIIKESNVYDRGIGEYKKGLEALYEAENIKEKIRNMEHDVWSF